MYKLQFPEFLANIAIAENPGVWKSTRERASRLGKTAFFCNNDGLLANQEKITTSSRGKEGGSIWQG